MATGPRYAVRFRRRREGKTNYLKRLALAKSGKPRLIVRKSSKYIMVQFNQFDPKGDKTLLTVNSSKLKDFGWKHNFKNIPAAYLTGLLAGKLAGNAKITQAVADIGLHTATKGAKVFAVLKGAADSGLKFALGEEIAPSKERIEGKHIADYRKIDLKHDFEAVKAKIISG